jgi:ABC-type glycerol-3-phosphate transport system permease component
MTGMLIFLGSSIVLSVIYRWIISPGSEINLFLFEHLEKVLVFANPDFAIKGIEMVEFVYGISVFIPIGIILYFAALKGSNFNSNEKSIERNVLNNTLIVFFVILISGISFLLQSVNSVFILTGGGPLNKTSTILNEIYNNAFMMYNVGYAASEQFILLILLLLSGLAIWFILEMTGFKIWVSDRETGINSRLKSSLSLIITIISIFLVIVLLVVFILWVFMPLFKAFSHSLDGYSKVLSESTFFFSLVRSILTLIPILILQTIISLLGGFALGRYKFIGSRFIFLILCLGLFITPQIFAPQLYEVFGELNMLNNLIPVNLLWLGSPLGIILFKLYFEGFNIEMERVNNEKDNQKKFSLKIKLVANTILMSVFVMFIFSLLSLNDLISSVTLIFEKNLLTLYQNNYMNVGMLNMDQGYVLAFAFMSLIPMILMGIIFILLQIVFFPKMKILTRK